MLMLLLCFSKLKLNSIFKSICEEINFGRYTLWELLTCDVGLNWAIIEMRNGTAKIVNVFTWINQMAWLRLKYSKINRNTSICSILLNKKINNNLIQFQTKLNYTTQKYKIHVMNIHTHREALLHYKIHIFRQDRSYDYDFSLNIFTLPRVQYSFA